MQDPLNIASQSSLKLVMHTCDALQTRGQMDIFLLMESLLKPCHANLRKACCKMLCYLGGKNKIPSQPQGIGWIFTELLLPLEKKSFNRGHFFIRCVFLKIFWYLKVKKLTLYITKFVSSSLILLRPCPRWVMWQSQSSDRYFSCPHLKLKIKRKQEKVGKLVIK